jgi:hypothetical protein
MKKVMIRIMLAMSAFMFFGCSAKTPPIALEPMSEKLRFDKITFKFEQIHTPKIKYQTSEELEKRINSKITTLLGEKNLLSTSVSMNQLVVNVYYYREFVGEAFPILATDSLGNPWMNYKIKVMDNNKTIRSYEANNLRFNGGLMSNLSLIAGLNRNNEYENQVADALAKEIVNKIEELR